MSLQFLEDHTKLHVEWSNKVNESVFTSDQEKELQKYAAGEKRGLAQNQSEGLSYCKKPCSSDPYSMVTSKVLNSLPPYIREMIKSHVAENSATYLKTASNLASASSSHARKSRASYYNMPMKELGYESIRQLRLRLDLDLPNVANWKSVADKLRFSYMEIKNLENAQHKTECMLSEAMIRHPNITVGALCEILESLNRHDVISHLENYFAHDFNRLGDPQQDNHFAHANGFSMPTPFDPVVQESWKPVQVDEVTTNVPEPGDVPQTTSSVVPEAVTTVKHYDAFLLFDAADKQFILQEFLPNLEKRAGIKFCIPQRDVHAGSPWYQAQLENMIDRCPKIVVVLSDEFLRSSNNKWALNIAVALDPACRLKKIIPVIYKPLHEKKGNILAGLSTADRTCVIEDEWFWDNLFRSLKSNE